MPMDVEETSIVGEEMTVTAPTTYLERTRGRILDVAERVRVVSEVQLVTGAEVLGCRPRGNFHLALTDRRLLAVTRSWLSARAELLWDTSTAGVSLSITRRQLGPNLINISVADPEGSLSFEWVRGHRPQDWETYRFRL